MSCPETPRVVAEYLDQQLPEAQRQALEAHLRECADCREEAASLALVDEQLRQWSPQPLISPLKLPQPSPAGRGWRRWAPLAASLVLAVALLFNLQLTRHEQGFSISFGAPPASLDAAAIEALVQQHSAAQAARQQQWLEQALLGFADSTAASLEQVVSWLELQREQDMALLEASLQDMIEREYRTVESVQQLASFVRQTALLD